MYAKTQIGSIPIAVRAWVGAVRTVYGDESADERQQRVFAVAGLLGSAKDWTVFRRKWLKRTDGKPFHAADCEAGKEDYKGIPKIERLRLYADLTKLLAASNLMGVGVAVSIRDFNELLRNRIYGGEEPYFLAFHTVVNVLGQWSAVSIPPDTVEFIFDHHPTNEYNAGALYHYVNQLNDAEFKKLMSGKVSFATRQEVGIQAADLLARESMKLLDNRLGPRVRPSRLSYEELRKNGRIRFRILTRGWCEGFLSKAQDDTYPQAEYHEWRAQHGLVGDTLFNRLRYESYRYTEQDNEADANI
jgi:hypothetical protein